MESQAEFAGVIFDCDGTLADTMPLHYRAWQQVLSKYSVNFEEKLFYELGGVPSVEIVRLLNERHSTTLDPQVIVALKEEIYTGLLPEAQPIQCVVDLVHEYAGHYPMAVASGGIRPLVERTLKALEIYDLFKVIATAEDVKLGKPAPDLFLYAAGKLEVPPHLCLVYEDSPLGLEAARRAGMRGIDIRALLEKAALPG